MNARFCRCRSSGTPGRYRRCGQRPSPSRPRGFRLSAPSPAERLLFQINGHTLELWKAASVSPGLPGAVRERQMTSGHPARTAFGRALPLAVLLALAACAPLPGRQETISLRSRSFAVPAEPVAPSFAAAVEAAPDGRLHALALLARKPDLADKRRLAADGLALLFPITARLLPRPRDR
jgi:hypothetical protein